MFTLMVVDDEPRVGRLIERILKKGKLKIQIVGKPRSGEEAIREALKLEPDIILMDIKMPGINGIEAAQEIKRQKPKIKIIFLTAYPEFDYAQEAIRLQASDYLLKPIISEKVTALLSKISNQIEIEKARLGREKKLRRQLKKVMPFLETEPSSNEQTRRQKIITESKKFMESNYQKRRLSVKDIASAVDLSSSYLSNLFKQETGLTVLEYLTNLRMEKAKELLKDVKLNVAQVAYKVGFRNPNYFGTIFKKLEGLTPGQFRKNY